MTELTPISLELLDETDGAVRLRASGCLADMAKNGPAVDLESMLGAEVFARRVLVDLNYVDFLDSSGVGWLLGAHRRFRSAGGALILHSVPPVVDHTLKILRMDQVLRMAKDEAEALSLVQT